MNRLREKVLISRRQLMMWILIVVMHTAIGAAEDYVDGAVFWAWLGAVGVVLGCVVITGIWFRWPVHPPFYPKRRA